MNGWLKTGFAVAAVALLCIGGIVVSAAAVLTPAAACTYHPADSSAPVDPADGSTHIDRCVGVAGWIQPVRASIVSGFRTTNRPGHDGVDLGAARGVSIRAAAGGTVVMVRCNISPSSWGCDRDGSPSTPGCGWYVDIAHGGGIYTRYCHMLTRPFVAVGQRVGAGQVIGVVGSSGHSSGPHLHFEVHLGNRSSLSAVDPVPFMAARQVPLGSR